MAAPSITKTSGGWDAAGSTNATIERLMDDAAYSSAHPDDTLVIAGPPRLGTDADYSSLSAVGMLQNITVNQQKPFQPLMSIGSSRSFFVGGKAQGSAQIQRLFMNKSNLLRKLYDNAIDADSDGNPRGLDPTKTAIGYDNEAAIQNNYMINLDSEVFLIPFGLGLLFKNKARQGIGGFYMELCVIPNFSIGVQAGQSMLMEGCSLFFDRVVPLNVPTTATNLTSAFDLIVKPSDYPSSL